MSDKPTQVPSLGQLLEGFPRNWGRWGPDDEVGALNFLGPEEVVAAAKLIRTGKVFTLQVPMADPAGDPVWPGARGKPVRVNVIDKGHVLSGKLPPTPGGIEGCDDMIQCYLQCSTQYDALGHTWFGDQIYNGFDAKTTIGGMTKASVMPIAERGVVGRGVLIDIARHRGKASLDRGETITRDDLLSAAQSQQVEIRKRDILLVRTGWIGLFFRDPDRFYGGGEGWLDRGSP
jgi:hypothetical protein